MSRAPIGAEVFADVLGRAGVDTIFGLPGSTEAALLETLRDPGEAGGLRYVLGLHEGAVVSMADGYARVTGGPGVVGLHTSVGTLNGASQIYNAHRDGSPVVVTAGHKDHTVLSEDGFCAHPDLPGAVRPFTKWAHQTLSAAELGRDLWRAPHAVHAATACAAAGAGRQAGGTADRHRDHRSGGSAVPHRRSPVPRPARRGPGRPRRLRPRARHRRPGALPVLGGPSSAAARGSTAGARPPGRGPGRQAGADGGRARRDAGVGPARPAIPVAEARP